MMTGVKAVARGFICGLPLIAAGVALLVSVTTSAHHSRAPFDLTRTVRVPGEIVRVMWKNPHVFYVLERTRGDGIVETWLLEGHSITGLKRQGWTSESLRVGDTVTVVANPNGKNAERAPGRQSALLSRVEFPDGRTLPPGAARGPAPGQVPSYARASSSKPEPATASEERRDGEEAGADDGKEQKKPGETVGRVFGNTPAPEPSSDFSGTWRPLFHLREVLLRQNVPPKGGRLDWPLTKAGLDTIAAYDPDDNPAWFCEGEGLNGRLPFWIYPQIWTRFDDRIEIRYQQKPASHHRTIWLDGRDRPDDYALRAVGYSVGRFSDPNNPWTLVVETAGFSDVTWGLATGLESSAAKRVVETYRLTNGTLKRPGEGESFGAPAMVVSVEIRDPVYLHKPVTVWGALQTVADAVYEPFDCDPENAQLHLEFE